MTDHSALIERLEAAAESASKTIMGRRGQSILHPLLAEAAAALRHLTEWRDISTAPKDGTEIIGVMGSGSSSWFEIMRWLDFGGWEYPDFSDYYTEDHVPFSPTHWLPLPSAPNQAKALK